MRVGNPTKAPSFSQHVERNRRGDHGGFCGLARRNVDAVSARVAGRGADRVPAALNQCNAQARTLLFS